MFLEGFTGFHAQKVKMSLVGEIRMSFKGTGVRVRSSNVNTLQFSSVQLLSHV